MMQHKTLWIAAFFVALLALTVAVPRTAMAACSDPAGDGGDMIYNNSHAVLQYCNGTNWVPMDPNHYSPQPMNFAAGTGTYLNEASLAVEENVKQATISFWFRGNTAGNHTVLAARGPGGFSIRVKGSPYPFQVSGWNSSGTEIVRLWSNDIEYFDGIWHHILVSFDLNDPSRRHIYIDGVDQFRSAWAWTNDFIDLSATDTGGIPDGFRIGRENANEVDIADLWIDFGTYIDLSVQANREKFLRDNRPVFLGTDGSLPTGKAPEIFLSGDPATWHTNDGSAGGFTKTGTIEATQPTLVRLVDPADDPCHPDNTPATGTQCSDGTYYAGISPDGNWPMYTHPNTYSMANINTGTQPTPYCVSPGFAETTCDTGEANTALNLGSHATRCRDSTVAGHDDWYLPAINELKITWDNMDPLGVMPTEYGYTSSSAIDSNNYHKVLQSTGNIVGVPKNFGRGGWCIRKQYEYRGSGCADPVGGAGDVRYNTDVHVMQFCDGTDWIAMGPVGDGGAGCSGPTGAAGDMVFNTFHFMMQYCEGDEWVGIDQPVTPPEDMVAHWTFEEGTGFSTNDVVGTRHGTFQNLTPAAWVTGKVGNYALDVSNSINSRAYTGMNTGLPLGASARTITLWMNANSFNTSTYDVLLEYGEPASAVGGDRLHVGAEDNDISVAFAGHRIVTNKNISTGQWYHVAVVVPNGATLTSDIEVYIDGFKEPTTDEGGTPRVLNTANAEMFLGGRRVNASPFNGFDGIIDDVRIYDRALSGSEIRALYTFTQ